MCVFSFSSLPYPPIGYADSVEVGVSHEVPPGLGGYTCFLPLIMELTPIFISTFHSPPGEFLLW